MSDACVTDSFARAKEAWSGSIRSPYPDGGASSGSYPPVQSLGHGRGRCQSRTRVGPFPGGRYSCRGAPLLGPPTDFASYFSGSRSDSRLAQCARMNGNTSASAAFANNVAYRMEPQRRVACHDARIPGRARCVTWVTQPPAFVGAARLGSRGRRIDQGDDVVHGPERLGDAGRHRGRHLHGAVDADEVVPNGIERDHVSTVAAWQAVRQTRGQLPRIRSTCIHTPMAAG
jgi:hypothetical protein